MRVNIYAEEMSEDIEIIAKEIDGRNFTGLRFYMYLPVTEAGGTQVRGKFLHRIGDDDSAAVTFWGKRDLRIVLRKALALLDEHSSPSLAEDVRERAAKALAAFWHNPWDTISVGAKDMYLGAAAAAIRSMPLPSESGWRTMEDAPRDGSCFLACIAGFVPLVAAWMEGRWASVPDNRPYPPTHWMPLPPAPLAPKD